MQHPHHHHHHQSPLSPRPAAPGGSASSSSSDADAHRRHLIASLSGTCESGESVLERVRRRLRRVPVVPAAAAAAPAVSMPQSLGDNGSRHRGGGGAPAASTSTMAEDFEAVIRRARLGLRPPDSRQRPLQASPPDPEDEAALWGSPDFADHLQRRLRNLRPAQEAPAWVAAAATAAVDRTSPRPRPQPLPPPPPPPPPRPLLPGVAAGTAAAANVGRRAAPSRGADDTDSQAASDILDAASASSSCSGCSRQRPPLPPLPPKPSPPPAPLGETRTTDDDNDSDEAADRPAESGPESRCDMELDREEEEDDVAAAADNDKTSATSSGCDGIGCQEASMEPLATTAGGRAAEAPPTQAEAAAAAAAAVSASLVILERSDRRVDVCRDRPGERCWRLLADLEAARRPQKPQRLLPRSGERLRQLLLGDLRQCGSGVGVSLACDPAMIGPAALAIRDSDCSEQKLDSLGPPSLPPLPPLPSQPQPPQREEAAEPTLSRVRVVERLGLSDNDDADEDDGGDDDGDDESRRAQRLRRRRLRRLLLDRAQQQQQQLQQELQYQLQHQHQHQPADFRDTPP